MERDLDFETRIRKSLMGFRVGSNSSHIFNLQSSTLWAMDYTSGKSGGLLLQSRPEVLVAWIRMLEMEVERHEWI